MLRFKQFISQFLFEAKAEHFSHIGLDPNNPEHKDLVDAYNAGVNRDPNVPKNPNQIKTFDQLKTSVAPHFAAIQQKRKEDEEDKKAFENKDAELLHHDPETGLKVFKVRNARGCVAAGGGATGCVYDRESGQNAMDSYDPDGEHSHIIHTPEKGNLSRISIIGVKPRQKHISGQGGNFQDKGNNTVSDSDWEMIRKKYKLDSVKVLHGIRGLRHPDQAKKDQEEAKRLVNHMNDKELYKVANQSRYSDSEVHNAIANHPNAGFDALYTIAYKSDDPEVHKAIANHPNAGEDTLHDLANKSNDTEVHKAITNHPNTWSNTIHRIAKKYNLEHDGSEESRTRISKAIDDHIKNKQNNPYQLESFISRLRRI
jgi:hypothetical protein